MSLRVLFFLLQLIPIFVLPAPAFSQGVWSGMVGVKPVMVCFNANGSGSYYYIDDLTPIKLNSLDKDNYWAEWSNNDATDPMQWELAAKAKGMIEGFRRNLKTGKTLALKLTLVDGLEDQGACARDSYNSRLEYLPTIERGGIIQFSPTRAYRKLQFAGQETVELLGPDHALSQLNSILKLDQSKEALDAYFKQRREFLARVGTPSVDERHTDVLYWDSNYITIRFYSWAAGEGRAGISSEHRTWNARTGDEVDLWAWFGSNRYDAKLPPKLKSYLYRSVKAKLPECDRRYRGEGTYRLTLRKNGLHIDEDAWGDGCEKEFVIPYAKLRPFLNSIGKMGVDSIIRRHR